MAHGQDNLIPPPARDLKTDALAWLGDQCERVLPVEAWIGHRVVVAVSGGADSVALFRTLNHLKQTTGRGPALAVVHVNHGLRGKESDQEAAFVQALANEFEASFFSCNVNSAGDASENGLRNQRYDAILEVAGEIGARYVFTAHHCDDQVETILFRVLRGTGLSGLQGIPACRVVNESVTLVRPFLNVSRATVEMAMQQIGQTFCTDSSNLSANYSRNFIRNHLLPEARTRFGKHIDASIVRLAEHAADAIEIEAMLVGQFFEEGFFERCDAGGRFKTQELAEQHSAVTRAILIEAWKQFGWPMADMTRERWMEIDGLVRNPPESGAVLNLPGDVRLELDRWQLKMTR